MHLPLQVCLPALLEDGYMLWGLRDTVLKAQTQDGPVRSATVLCHMPLGIQLAAMPTFVVLQAWNLPTLSTWKRLSAAVQKLSAPLTQRLRGNELKMHRESGGRLPEAILHCQVPIMQPRLVILQEA